jgi:hypothetical protein
VRVDPSTVAVGPPPEREGAARRKRAVPALDFTAPELASDALPADSEGEAEMRNSSPERGSRRPVASTAASNEITTAREAVVRARAANPAATDAELRAAVLKDTGVRWHLTRFRARVLEPPEVPDHAGDPAATAPAPTPPPSARRPRRGAVAARVGAVARGGGDVQPGAGDPHHGRGPRARHLPPRVPADQRDRPGRDGRSPRRGS